MVGAIIQQSWGKQKITRDARYLVSVFGDEADCYVEPAKSFDLWHVLGNREISGQKLIDLFPAVTELELEMAKCRRPAREAIQLS